VTRESTLVKGMRVPSTIITRIDGKGNTKVKDEESEVI
jgi:hypothetical protein